MGLKRYSDDDLQEFKELILQRIEKTERLILSLKSYHNGNGTDDTYRSFKCLEEGQNCLGKEEINSLLLRQNKFLLDLQGALIRINNKTYGICRITDNLIPKERLRCVPHATLSIEGKQKETEIKNGNRKNWMRR